MTAISDTTERHGFSLAQYLICLTGIVWREALRFIHQRERFIAALVRPLVWLFIFAAGFRQVLGVSIIPPYEVYVLYEVYITPGLVAMIQLFNGMQSSLSMVYDREMGNMRTLLVSPLPRWFLLVSKLVAGVAVSILQVYVYLLVAWFWEVHPPTSGYLFILPALVLSGLMVGSVGLLLSSLGIRAAALLALAGFHPSLVGAETTSDWPCIQRKVPEISITAVWSRGDPPAAARELAKTPAIVEFAGAISARRMPIEQAATEI